ncbi:MAG: cysteine hydrolase [Eubacterium sp.]|nr:cysteine hydrolase [Eubacterium sp.]
MKKEALLLIDIQDIYFTPGPMLLHKPRCAAKNAARVLEKFRTEDKTVIHVQHNFKVLAGINSLVKPLESEKIIHKEYPSSFLGTELHEYLQENEITDIVVAGMMSHMCVDTTVRACQDYGYNVTLIDDACTTMSLKHDGKKIDAETVHAVYMASLAEGFANVIKTEKYLSNIRKK